MINDNNYVSATTDFKVPTEPGFYLVTPSGNKFHFEFDNPLESWEYETDCLMIKFIGGTRIYIPWHSISYFFVVPMSGIRIPTDLVEDQGPLTW